MAFRQDTESPRSQYWVRPALFVLLGLTVLVCLNVGYSALNTLARLDQVEAARDQWQRPSEVVQALDLKPGDSVADIGCGSGYFSLKLAAAVGPKGRVISEDIRRLPLTFLWIRAVKDGAHNLHVLRGETDDPHLRPDSVNAVLISNAYHEFAAPRKIIDHIRQALRPDGRLVIIDRAPDPLLDRAAAPEHHEIASEQVEMELRAANFRVTSRRDDFIESDPDHKRWWMIVAQDQ